MAWLSRLAVVAPLALAGLAGSSSGVAGAASRGPATASAGTSALTVVPTAVEPGPFSAVVRWQASEPARVVVEYGRSDEYGVWTPPSSAVAPSGSAVLAGLEPGSTYRLRVSASAGIRRAEARGLNRATYVVAVNPTAAPLHVTLTVPGLSASSVRVFGEARSVPVRSGAFRDGFAPLGAHVYVAAPG